MIENSVKAFASMYPDPWTAGCAALSGAAALEMISRIVVGRMNPKFEESGKYAKKWGEDLNGNLSGAVLYSLCAINPFPRAAILGAAGFIVYSLCEQVIKRGEDADKNPMYKDKYFLTRIIGEAFEYTFVEGGRYVFDVIKRTYEYLIVEGLTNRVVKPLWEDIVQPFWSEIVVPLAVRIKNFVVQVFSALMGITERVLELSPTWLCVSAVAIAAISYQSYRLLSSRL